MRGNWYLQFRLGVPAEHVESLAVRLEQGVDSLWGSDHKGRLSGLIGAHRRPSLGGAEIGWLSGLIPIQQREPFEQLLGQLTQEMGWGRLHPAYYPLSDREALAAQIRQRSPLSIGRFWLHYKQEALCEAPSGSSPIFLDIMGAFGSGNHITTEQCLRALEKLSLELPPPVRVADIGCGCGVLSLAIASLWRCSQVAADIDPASVLVTRDNLCANGVTHVQTVVSDGFAHTLLEQQGPYDLIVGNILTEPLLGLAHQFERQLAPQGVALLSGIRTSQCDGLLKVYEQAGLHAIARVQGTDRSMDHEDWSTVLLKRP